ncbi:MAG: DUF6653 family protein [candidate division WOR-3 bacterium]
MNRKNVLIPKYHYYLPNIFYISQGIGAIVFIWGAGKLQIWLTILGGVIMIICKLWFADRMVWLYEDMKDATPEYKSWLY